MATFWFYPLQDVLLSDKNLRCFVSQSESCPGRPAPFNREPHLWPPSITTRDNRGVSETRNSFPLMNAKRNLGGRPKLTEGKREKKITARFTEDEYKTVEELETTLGITKTELVRMRLLENAVDVILNAKELITALDSIGAELGRCGNNINQLAKYANILQKKNKSDPSIVKQFNALLSAYLEKQERLEISLRRIIRAIGR